MPGMDEQLVNAREAALSCVSSLYWARQALEALDVEVLRTSGILDSWYPSPFVETFEFLYESTERLRKALLRPVLFALETANLAFGVTPWTEEFDDVSCKSYHHYSLLAAKRFMWLPERFSPPHDRPKSAPDWFEDIVYEGYQEPEESDEEKYTRLLWESKRGPVIREDATTTSRRMHEYYRRLLECVNNEPKYDVDLLGRLIWEECDHALAHLETSPGNFRHQDSRGHIPERNKPSKKKSSAVRRNYLVRISDGKMALNPESENGLPLTQVWDEEDYIIPASLNPYIDHKERLYPLDELVRAFYLILDDDYRSNNTFLPVRCDSERGINDAVESTKNLLNEAMAAIDEGELPAPRTEPPYPIRSVDFVCWLDERYGFKNKPWIAKVVQWFLDTKESESPPARMTPYEGAASEEKAGATPLESLSVIGSGDAPAEKQTTIESPATAEEGSEENAFQNDESVWHIAFSGTKIHVPHSKGAAAVHHLILCQGEWVEPELLEGIAHQVPTPTQKTYSKTGEERLAHDGLHVNSPLPLKSVEDEGVTRLRNELKVAKADADEAERIGNVPMRNEAEEKIKWIRGQLTIGLKARLSGTPRHRCLDRVRSNIKNFCKNVLKPQHPTLCEHLCISIEREKGKFRYNPAQPVSWNAE